MDAEKIYTVSQLNVAADNLLKKQIGDVWVRGEITGLKKQASGHTYFTLKDEGAACSMAFFKFAAAKSAVKLEEGKQILVFGTPGVYKERGSYQMVVKFVLEEGAGKLQQEFERLKKQLGDEGLFAPERKKPMPSMPSVVAFITSPTGAVWHDFTQILSRRGWKGRAILYPAAVQGINCGSEIVAGLKAADANPDVDLIVVGRGGGSLEDLWGFNTEEVVRAMAGCSKPVMSAVGHETDVTLADFVSDKRAETPSAAAELIVSEFTMALERVSVISRRWPQLIAQAIERLSNRLAQLKANLAGHSPKQRIENLYQALDHRAHKAKALVQGRMQQASGDMKTLAARINGLSPQRTLERGYTMLKDASGKCITRVAALEAKGDEAVSVVFADGERSVKRSS